MSWMIPSQEFIQNHFLVYYQNYYKGICYDSKIKNTSDHYLALLYLFAYLNSLNVKINTFPSFVGEFMSKFNKNQTQKPTLLMTRDINKFEKIYDNLSLFDILCESEFESICAIHRITGKASLRGKIDKYFHDETRDLIIIGCEYQESSHIMEPSSDFYQLVGTVIGGYNDFISMVFLKINRGWTIFDISECSYIPHTSLLHTELPANLFIYMKSSLKEHSIEPLYGVISYT